MSVSGFAFLSRKEFRAAFHDIYGSPEESPLPGDLLVTLGRLARGMRRDDEAAAEPPNAETQDGKDEERDRTL